MTKPMSEEGNNTEHREVNIQEATIQDEWIKTFD